MKKSIIENAANRKSYVGEIYNIGEKAIKDNILDSLPAEWSKLHKDGKIHIHDLDAYGLTYNCLTFNLKTEFPYKRFNSDEDSRKIIGVFDYLKELFEKMGNEQSGGMSIANFDNDISEIFRELDVALEGNEKIIKASISSLIFWCNEMHTRMGQTSYYITFNIGLCNNEYSRFIAESLIEEFDKAGPLIYKPNIVFKVSKFFNLTPNTKNFDILNKALLCSAKKMIPTYLLCDNENTKPESLSIMGCRTRVVENVYKHKGAIGRGNIANVSINLPRIALELKESYANVEPNKLLLQAMEEWKKIAEVCKDILLNRFYLTCKQEKDLFHTNINHNLWCENFKSEELFDIFKNGTLSIGFIGLNEFIYLLFEKKYWEDENIYNKAVDFVEFMSKQIEKFPENKEFNFSLLATSGELISGKFIEKDEKLFTSNIYKKGYYTNSFHIDVDSKIAAYKKIKFEGPFHKYCKGGSITYIELAEAPIGNNEGLLELLECAIQNEVKYFGINFPNDVCNKCNSFGIFDLCPQCKSENIKRIRRVSGYLEEQNYFTFGKLNESKNRRGN